MDDRLTELKILVCQTCEDIYRKSYDNKLSEVESAYFISSVANALVSGIYQDNEKKLRGEDNENV